MTPFTISYAMVSRAQFRPAHSSVDGPLQDIYYKVLPLGTSSLTACVLGFPALGVAPFGLEHQVCSQTHVFHRLKVALPRLELPARCVYQLSLGAYTDSDGGAWQRPEGVDAL